MDERDALTVIGDLLDHAGDDAAVFGDHLLSIDMLHEETDFPVGTTRYTAGWRSVGASLSDIAAMGGKPLAAVASYGDPSFDEVELREFIDGACDVCMAVNASYVGGDLDQHQEFTVAAAVLGVAKSPVYRSGARPGNLVCVSGTIGRTAAAMEIFKHDIGRANDLFQFLPRIETGIAVAPYATAMMDSSDGLARSLHQLSDASDCGFTIDRESLPIDEAVSEVPNVDRIEYALHFGEDFELVFTVEEKSIDTVRAASPTPITVVGAVQSKDRGITMDQEPLRDKGYTHGTGEE